MAQVDSESSISMPADPARRRFLTVAAGASVASVGTLAVAAMPAAAPASVACAADPAFALIAEKLAADVAHGAAIDVEGEAESQYGVRSQETWDARERSAEMCWRAHEVDWKLATTPPTTLAGVAAVLRFANKIEDEGMEWPSTDTIGPEGWHYQLRATMAQAIETITCGKAVRS